MEYYVGHLVLSFTTIHIWILYIYLCMYWNIQGYTLRALSSSCGVDPELSRVALHVIHIATSRRRDSLRLFHLFEVRHFASRSLMFLSHVLSLFRKLYVLYVAVCFCLICDVWRNSTTRPITKRYTTGVCLWPQLCAAQHTLQRGFLKKYINKIK